MDQRIQLIREHEEGESVAALADAYEVSRKTVYKWLERYQQEGAAGLAEHSRAPHHRPQQVSEEVIRSIVEARQHWKWGPRKLRIKLQEQDPQQHWPARSTLAEILKRCGLSHARKKRLRTPLFAGPLADVAAPNQTWCADYKGWFRTGDGTRCDPLTITDAHSRYLLRCHITPHSDTAHVAAVFQAAFAEYGLPQRIRTDNGAPFASRAPGGLSRLSLPWIKLGIVAERSRPATPQDNGRHERMHRTLKQETLRPPAAHPRRQQERFQQFRERYNHQRPHEALADQTPASQYVCSPRALPRRVPEIEYPGDVLLRRVDDTGKFRWQGGKVFVSEIFAYEVLGLRPIDERYSEVWFSFVRLGWLDARELCFHRTLPRPLQVSE